MPGGPASKYENILEIYVIKRRIFIFFPPVFLELFAIFWNVKYLFRVNNGYYLSEDSFMSFLIIFFEIFVIVL